jgi:hypothetical protein
MRRQPNAGACVTCADSVGLELGGHWCHSTADWMPIPAGTERKSIQIRIWGAKARIGREGSGPAFDPVRRLSRGFPPRNLLSTFPRPREGSQQSHLLRRPTRNETRPLTAPANLRTRDLREAVANLLGSFQQGSFQQGSFPSGWNWLLWPQPDLVLWAPAAKNKTRRGGRTPVNLHGRKNARPASGSRSPAGRWQGRHRYSRGSHGHDG